MSKGFDKGKATTVIVEKQPTSSDFRKGNKNNRNPYFDRLIIRQVYRGVKIGTSYANSLANAHNNGIDDKEERIKGADVQTQRVWHIAFPSTDKVAYADWFRKKASEPQGEETEAYLKMQYTRSQIENGTFIVEKYYLLDGVLVEDEETINAINEWKASKTHTMSSTQTNLGLSKEEERFYICPNIEAVKVIKQGEKLWRA